MFDAIHSKLQNHDSVVSTTPKRKTPSRGIIYFQLETDDAVTPELRYFQPESSTVLIDDGDLVEFDIRLGKWEPQDSSEVMRELRESARRAERDTCIYTSRIDAGGGGQFCPHVRGWDGTYPVNELLKFIDLMTAEVKFLQTKTATPENSNPNTNKNRVS